MESFFFFVFDWRSIVSVSFLWLQGMSKEKSKVETEKWNAMNNSNDKYEEITTKYQRLLESIVSLLTPEKSSTSCQFLSKFL